MSERIKNDDVTNAFETLREAAEEAQINGADQWGLYFGQSTEGYTCWITAGRGQRRVSDNLGRSKREAAAAMLHMAAGINMALHPEPAPARRGRRAITAVPAK